MYRGLRLARRYQPPLYTLRRPRPPPAVPPVTVLLDRARAGDDDAFARVVGQLYDELRAVARGQRRRLGASDTVNTTAVVHEAYAKLAGREAPPEYADRAHFFRVAARAMRDVIVDHARAQSAAKRGGRARPLSLDATAVRATGRAPTVDLDVVLSVHDAMERLAALDAEAARVAELRYFAGLTNEQAAEALALSVATVKRRWTMARAWLHRELSEPPA